MDGYRWGWMGDGYSVIGHSHPGVHGDDHNGGPLKLRMTPSLFVARCRTNMWAWKIPVQILGCRSQVNLSHAMFEFQAFTGLEFRTWQFPAPLSAELLDQVLWIQWNLLVAASGLWCSGYVMLGYVVVRKHSASDYFSTLGNKHTVYIYIYMYNT